jgi:uncharacterized phage protein gp47/JayE
MMILPLQTFSTLLENMAAGLQGSAAQIIDLSIGSVMRALLESCASVALWMQWLILQVLSLTRAATSVGSDLDSWMADFSLARLPGAPSSGMAAFSRYTTGMATTIPVGASVKTTDGSLTFVVTADSSNPTWDGVGGYSVAAAVAGVLVPIQAVTPGAAGNVVSGAVGLLASPIAGIDLVTNPDALLGGVDAESDAALRARFQLYVNSRSLATVGAVGAAIQSLQQGLRYVVLENVGLDGQPFPGNFCVVVDDGSGTASDLLLGEVSAAVDAVRPIGSTFSVTRPSQVGVAVGMTIVTSSAALAGVLGMQIQQAVLAWIAGLPMGGLLAVSKLESIAHGTDISVLSVTGASLNGASADIQAGAGAVICAGAVTVTVIVS